MLLFSTGVSIIDDLNGCFLAECDKSVEVVAYRSLELNVIARNSLPPSVTKEQKVPLHWLYRASPGKLSRYNESFTHSRPGGR
jgi:hypothetical protein